MLHPAQPPGRTQSPVRRDRSCPPVAGSWVADRHRGGMQVVLDDTLEGDGARIHDRPAGVRSQQLHPGAGDVDQTRRGCSVDALGDGQHPVHVIGDRRETGADDLGDDPCTAVSVAGLDPQDGGFGEQRPDAVTDGVVLIELGLGPQQHGVVALPDALPEQRMLHGVGVGDPGGVADRLCFRDECPGAVHVVGEEGVHRATGQSEELWHRLSGLFRQPVERRQLALDADDVDGFECCRQPPQMGVEPGPHVGDMRRDVLQPRGDMQSLGQVVGAPGGGELRVQCIGDQRRVADFVGECYRFRCERSAAVRVVAVDPRAGERRCESRAKDRNVGRGKVRLVQQRRTATRVVAEPLE